MKRFRFRWFLISLVIAFVGPLSVLAYYKNPVSSQPGFTHPTPLQDDDTLAGKMLDGSRIIRSSPVVGDLDGNPQNGLEIVVGDRNGKLFALANNGRVLWETQVATCSVSGDDSLLNGAPALFDLYPERPGLEVIVGYGKIHADPSCQGGIRAFSSNGQLLWDYQIPINQINKHSGVFSTPSVTDVDGKGDIIIVAGSADLYLHVLNKDGSLRWKYFAMDTIWSSPAFADVNDDGRKDIIIGTDFTPGVVCNPDSITPYPETNSYYEDAKGFLYAFPADPKFTADPLYCAHDGGKLIGFGKGFLWRVEFDQAIYSAPAIADLDDDGQPEVVVGSGCFYGNDPKPGKWVKIFDLATGREERTLNAPECVASAPAIGDITGDGKPEIVAAVASGGSAAPAVPTPPTGGRLVVWTYDDPNPILNFVVSGTTQEQADMSEPFNNPLIADVDGNGSHEVVIVVQNSVMIFDWRGRFLTPSCPTGGPLAHSCLNRRSMFMWMPIRNTPAIADIDNDGKLEIVAAGSHTSRNVPANQNKAFVYVWRDLDQAIFSDPGPYPRYSAPWPQFQRDPAHNGLLLARKLRVNATNLQFMTDGNQSDSYQLTLRSNDGSLINVQVSEHDPHNIIELTASTLTVGNSSLASTSASLTITVNASGKPVGVYEGRVILQGNDVPSVEIPLTVRVVAELHRTFIPMAIR